MNAFKTKQRQYHIWIITTFLLALHIPVCTLHAVLALDSVSADSSESNSFFRVFNLDLSDVFSGPNACYTLSSIKAIQCIGILNVSGVLWSSHFNPFQTYANEHEMVFAPTS